MTPGRCAIIGAGLAGSAVAASLARRGWRVDVLDQADAPASGASGLPAGLLAPHQSLDDNLLSQLTRVGIAMTIAQCEALLVQDQDWARTGILERRMGDPRPCPRNDEWTRPALHGDWWHEQAAWIRPAALARAWLDQPGVQWVGNTRIETAGSLRSDYDLVVVAAAQASQSLVNGLAALTPVRGQVSWSPGRARSAPPHPVNGNGHFIQLKDRWLCGSTYGRGETDLAVRPQDHAANFERLRHLLPEVANEIEGTFTSGQVRAWTGIRCASRDRRPLVGPVADGIWVSTAMGSRGLTFCVLCAELLGARLHGEPWPVSPQLAQALDVARA